MKNRLLSLALVLTLCLSLLSTAAFARETDYFDPLPETFDFQTLRYDDSCLQEMEAACAAAMALLQQDGKESELCAAYDQLEAISEEITTQGALIQILYYQNPVQYEQAYTSMAAGSNAITQTVITTVQAMLTDPVYGEMLTAYVGPEDAAELLEASVPTEEQLAISQEITALVTRYQSAYAQGVSVTRDGRTWTEYSALDAYYAQELTYTEFSDIYTALYGEMNAILGQFYIEMTALRNRLARTYGYNNYADYAYAEVFGRDYTPADAAGFQTSVKAHLVPIFQTLFDAYNYNLFYNGSTYQDASQEMLLDTIEPYMDDVSSELSDAFQYLRQCGLIDAALSNTKLSGAFTVPLDSYDAAYIYSDRAGGNHDLTTIVHEFGHFSAFCYGESSASYDIMEVHSQGLEALYLQFADALYGDEAQAQVGYTLFNLLYSVISGCMYDELQQYAYTADGLTLDALNRKSAQLMAEYGLTALGPDGVDYSWIDIPHTFESPMYYISYATSAIMALEIYMESQTAGFEAAADRYLAFVAASGESDGFQAVVNSSGLDNPFAPGAVERFAQRFEACLDKQLYKLPYTDVAGCWAKGDITLLYQLGVMNGTSSTAFSPDATLTRGMAVTVLHRMLGEPESAVQADTVFSDVAADKWYTDAVGWVIEAGITNGTSADTFSPDANVSCQEFAVMLFRYCYGFDYDYTDEPAPDGAAAWAADALCWSRDLDIFETGDGEIAPADSLTRAELAAALVNALG